MSKLKKILPYSIIFLPLLSVYTISIFYPIDNSVGKEVSFRPPGYVFAIVWPFLLIFLGISWFKRLNSNIKINLIYIGLVILLSIWGILYNINRIYGLIDIILSLIFTMTLFFINFNKFDKFKNGLLIPLIFWLIFASILNIYSI